MSIISWYYIGEYKIAINKYSSSQDLKAAKLRKMFQIN